MTASGPPSPATALWRHVVMLGITQIIAWGTLTYGIAVLAPAISAELGMSTSTVFAAFSLGLGFSGLAAPAVGRAIDRQGGGRVMAGGSLLAALAMALVALSDGPLLFFLGWIIAGLAMAANLYDASFAALSQFAGARYRQALTALTLMGGLASTVFWPLSWWIDEFAGWRAAFWVFALLHLLLCLPLHLLLPRPGPAPRPVAPAPASGEADTAQRRQLLWLATAFTLAAFVVSGMAAHVVGALRASGLETATAIAAASLIGPMQVLGRILEFTFARNLPAVRVGLVSLLTMALAMLLLLLAGAAPLLAFAAACAYGLANGVLSIVRGTVPAELFGREAYGSLMGRLAQPAFFAKAVAPLAVALLIGAHEAYGRMALLFVVLMAGAVAAYGVATRRRP
ncbi:MAG: MFS transporter [Pseudazoarcus pumilus]|nr:MFS transporter [Pseudazoarcus pumilus]